MGAQSHQRMVNTLQKQITAIEKKMQDVHNYNNNNYNDNYECVCVCMILYYTVKLVYCGQLGTVILVTRLKRWVYYKVAASVLVGFYWDLLLAVVIER